MRGGAGPGRRPRLLHNNTLNEILVFDLSLATGLYALTNYAGTVMGTRRRGISRSLRDVSNRAARAGLDWNATRRGQHAGLNPMRAGVWAHRPLHTCTLHTRPEADLA